MKNVNIEKLLDRFNAEYEKLYNGNGNSGTAEDLEEMDRIFEEYPEVVAAFNKARFDILSSDRECAAFARAFNGLLLEGKAEDVAEKIDAVKTRSAWSQGVKWFAQTLAEGLQDDIRMGWIDSDVFSNRRTLEKALLNGAADWRQFSEGGCALIYDGDIAKKLCNPSELKRTDNGRKAPNSRESWIDVQSRALFQAAQLILNAAF